MTNYKYLDGLIPENEKELLAQYQDAIECAISEYDFENSYDTVYPIKQILWKEKDISKKIILYNEISVQLAHKLLCDWEKISLYYAKTIKLKGTKPFNIDPDSIIILKQGKKKDEVALSLFLQRLSELILSTSVYDILTQQSCSDRLISDFNKSELSQSLFNTNNLIAKQLANYHVAPNKNSPSDYIQNINNKKDSIFKILINNESQVRYLQHGNTFFPIIYEMMIFYFRHKQLLEHPSCQALRTFYYSKKTQTTLSTSHLDTTVLMMENLLTTNAINLAEFITIINLNNLDCFTICHFSKTYRLNPKILEELWSKIKNQKNGIRQHAIQTLPEPIFTVAKIGAPIIGFYQALKLTF